MAEKHVGKAKELKAAFEDAAAKAPPGGEFKVEIFVTTTRNPIGDYKVVLTPGSP